MKKNEKPNNGVESPRWITFSNKVYLGVFFSIICAVFILLLVKELFLDLGWWNGKFHINYYHNPSLKGNHPWYLNPYYDIPSNDWGNYNLNPNDAIWIKWTNRLIRQPHFFWTFTQFTWITTSLVFIIVFVRFFKFRDRFPVSLQWILTHSTLYIITMLDTVVMIVFWGALSKNFSNYFSTEPVIWWIQDIVTIIVHAVVPIFLLIYTIMFAFFDAHARLLNKCYIFVGIGIGLSYIIYYIFIAYTWDDPYSPFTILRNNKGWLQLGLLAIADIILVFASYFLNNIVIKHFNKFYIHANQNETKTIKSSIKNKTH